MARLEGEPQPAVVEEDPARAGHDVGPETARVAVDERHPHAGAVDDAEIGRVAVERRDRERVGPVRVDRGAALLDQGRSQQRGHIGALVEHNRTVVTRLGRSLDEEVGAQGAVVDPQAVGDRGGQQDQVGLTGRRRRPDHVAERLHGDRRHPAGLRLDQILGDELVGAGGEQPGAELPAVEALTALRGDRPQGPGRAGSGHDLAFARGRGQLVVLHVGHGRGETVQERRHGKPSLGQVDRRGEHLLERESSEALVEGQPTIDRARDRGRPDVALVGEGGQALGSRPLGIRAGPRPAGRIERRRPCTPLVVDQRPEITSHAAQVRRGDREHGVRPDRGVHRRTAPSQQIDARGGREVIDGRHHPVGGVAGHCGWDHAGSLPPAGIPDTPAEFGRT